MLLLRITLGIAIVAALATTALVWVQVKPQVEGIIAKRDEFEGKWKTELAARQKAVKELQETSEKLKTTEDNLAKTTEAKNKAEANVSTLDASVKSLTGQLNQAKEEITRIAQQLSAWAATGLTVDQVKATVAELKTAKDANAAMEEEKKLLTKDIDRLNRELLIYRGTNDAPVVLKQGTKGKIMVVDPKWDFVVIDIGINQELLPNGILMVSRAGKLIGKIKVATVQQDRAIANILPGWKLEELMEGDLVFY